MALSLMYCGLTFALPLAADSDESAQGYVAAKDSVKQFFEALSARMKKPVIVSNLAAKKKISGNFDFSAPQRLLETITSNMGLVWYYDGHTLYIFDASELKNSVVRLKNSSVAEVKNFLVSAELYDERYPLRSEVGSQTFYLSAPPVYFDLVLKTAANLDQLAVQEADTSSLMAIPLYNSFVEDRKYRYRDETITIPGVASVIRSLTANGMKMAAWQAQATDEQEEEEEEEEHNANAREAAAVQTVKKRGSASMPAGSGILVIANPDNNSLLVRGEPEELNNIKRLVSMLDVPKRHIEMSVWIVDLHKDELEQLGVSWRGSVNLAGQFGVSLNGGISSTVDGASFMAGVMALSQQNRANIVSRPMLLTQENVPAIFDNSRTFYTRLIGERSTSLEHVTYGTSLSVLPRFSDGEEIEMMLNVEDGNEYRREGSSENSLPEVGRTNISTVARVPKGKSLLIGGYTRDENSHLHQGVPGLKDIPVVGRLFSYRQQRSANMVRVFLIQPKEIDALNAPDGNRLIRELRNKPAQDQLFDWMNNFLDAQR
ncbi:type III secretion system outer membrane ring subunit SctC [Erwiniaceae bacterium BAC15a-03b]|uniref:Type 3 secretion system secretin n=1 Tax=Winslowiella arboricola TaxID=2978220 RepID=A0A9J6PPY5_9GAMM|nr:type III secretion system outer membrane ring subunit SctC [Winslowiella arboricola]MCU5773770.1 type III secretion system outer membrane ring subunit SctC [Winslowiella arboricola]MCU5777680.1 type III secretion system outer membrane ring subunit SctC [Winslowiella arboricola]